MIKILIVVATIGILGFGYQYSKSARRPPVAAVEPAVASAANPADPSDPAVEFVKANSLPGYASKTVGKAFEARFQNARWSSFQTPDGATIVDFSGVVRSDVLSTAGMNVNRENPIVLRSKCIDSLGIKGKQPADAGKESSDANEVTIENCIASQAVPVKFQFRVFSEKKTFELIYIDHMPFGETAPGLVLNFVYQQST